MTAVCYDGELFAADRMSRVRNEAGESQLHSLEKVKILTNFDNVIFDGEKVHAVGRSGRVRVSKIMIRQLRRVRDLALDLDILRKAVKKKFTPEEMNDANPSFQRLAKALRASVTEEELESLAPALDKVSNAVIGDRETAEEKPAASIMIMTSNHIHVLRVFKDYRVEWEKNDRATKMAIGSGKIVALFLMQHLGMNAADAVACIELHSPSCGGGVVFTTRKLCEMSTPLQILPHSDLASLSQNLLQSSIHAASRRLLNLPA